MHILVDSSLSMDLPAGNQSKWDRAIRALNTFIADPKSAGLGVGLTFFPNRTPTNVNTCRLDYYTTPAVTIAPLPMNAGRSRPPSTAGRAAATPPPVRAWRACSRTCAPTPR